MSKKKYGFEIIKNEPDWKLFRTTCDCMHLDDDCWVDIDYDRELNMVSMDFTVKTCPKSQYQLYRENIFKKFWIKTKLVFKLIFDIPLEYESSFIFRGNEHIENFAELISELGRNCEKETTELIQMKKELDKLKHRDT